MLHACLYFKYKYKIQGILTVKAIGINNHEEGRETPGYITTHCVSQ